MNRPSTNRLLNVEPLGFMVFGFLLVGGLLFALSRDGVPADAPSPPRDLESVFAEWRSVKDADDRQHLAEEMIRDGHLIGMTRERVEAVLGKPNPRRMSAAYGDPKYVVGPSGIDDMWLCIHVEEGTVRRAELRSD